MFDVKFFFHNEAQLLYKLFLILINSILNLYTFLLLNV